MHQRVLVAFACERNPHVNPLRLHGVPNKLQLLPQELYLEGRSSEFHELLAGMNELIVLPVNLVVQSFLANLLWIDRIRIQTVRSEPFGSFPKGVVSDNCATCQNKEFIASQNHLVQWLRLRKSVESSMKLEMSWIAIQHKILQGDFAG